MITQKGFKVTSSEEFYSYMMTEFKKSYPDMTESYNSVLSIISRVIAKNENKRDEDITTRYMFANVSTAYGEHLDRAVLTAGVNRISGTKSFGKVLITKSTNVAQVIIPLGALIEYDSIKYKLSITNALVISKPTVEVNIESVEAGDFNNIGIGMTMNTVDTMIGIEKIITTTKIEGATDTELDAGLRARYYRRLNAYYNSSVKGIIDAVREVEGVTAVDATDNDSHQVSGTMQPHSVSVWVEGGSEESIANIILKTKPAGIYSNGDIEKTIKLGQREYKIRFSRFDVVQTYFKIEVATDKLQVPTDAITEIQTEIIQYVKEHQTIRAYEIVNHLSQKLPWLKGVKSVLFDTNPNPVTSSDLIALSGQTFTSTKDKISVVIL